MTGYTNPAIDNEVLTCVTTTSQLELNLGPKKLCVYSLHRWRKPATYP
jgi:hypothetical protein